MHLNKLKKSLEELKTLLKSFPGAAPVDINKNDQLAPTSPLGKKEKTTFNKNGQWKLDKYGSAVTVGAPGASAMGGVVGSANKAEKDPMAKPKFLDHIVKPEDVKDVGTQGFAVKLPNKKKKQDNKK